MFACRRSRSSSGPNGKSIVSDSEGQESRFDDGGAARADDEEGGNDDEENGYFSKALHLNIVLHKCTEQMRLIS